ncbi:efflux RND transporter permease subunit [Marinicella rhabdoformis]|uniref:efflux RND transporter permease subunit n=1 Tax=Marinicella rhabdoformis TaxID=2580566 RepID=UPI0012AEBBB5|nr:efflux RND transporter permease subunit [Marinicella rhabdoformis]
MKGLTHFAVTRRVTVSMMAITIMLFGVIAMKEMPVTLLPSLEYPTMTIRTEYENAGPEEIELLITKPLEESVGVVKGISRVFSTSTTGRSDVKLEFTWDADMKRAAYDVRDRMDAVRLPLDVDAPILLRFNPSTDPVIQLALSLDGIEGEAELKALRSYADHILKKKLDPVAGVAAVKISGGYEKEIEIQPDQFRMAQLGLTISDISSRLRQENINLTGGAIKQGSQMFLVRTINQFEDINSIKDLIIANKDGRIIKIKDLAEVKLGHKDRKSINRLNGKEAIEIAIYKEGDSNTVSVAEAVKEKINQLKKELPNGSQLKIINDQSLFIKDAIDNVVSSAIIGGFLAILVIFLFLRDAWATVIIGALIPVSVIAGFFFMYRAGVSFNIMSLGGVALAVGLLVDNGIVVLENIAAKMKGSKGDELLAVEQGASEVSGAITASTLTTIAVFLPLIFVQGIAGQLFKDQALTVTFTLIVSLVFALLLIPMMSSLKAHKKTHLSNTGQAEYESKTRIGRGIRGVRRGFFNNLFESIIWFFKTLFKLFGKLLGFVLYFPAKGVNGLYNLLLKLYKKLLPWALNHRWVVLTLAVVTFALTLQLLPRLGMELIPDLEANKAKVVFKLPEGETIESTDTFFKKISAKISEIEGVQFVYGISGEGNKLDASALSGGENSGEILLSLKIGSDKQRIQEDLLSVLNQKAGLQSELAAGQFFDLAVPIEIELAGNDLDLLKENAKKMAQSLSSSPYFVNVDSGVEIGNPEIQLYFDQEKIASLGMNVSQVANNVVNKVLGKVETNVHWQDQKVELRVRTQETQRDSVEDVRNLIINPNSTSPIRLSDVADVRLAEGPGQIERRDQQRVIVVTADIQGIALGDAVALAKEKLQSTEIHPLVYTQVTGQNEDLEASNQSMVFALGLAVFLVYMILASQFESLVHPFVILISIPLAFIGAIWALYLTGTTISVVVFIGLIMLAGIVVNNAIVLIDLIKQLMAQGMNKTAAIIEAGHSRLRPIIMTTMTTVLGLMPMVITIGESSAGSEIRAPMAITVMGGLMVSTFLTLVVIPVLFSLMTKERQDVE